MGVVASSIVDCGGAGRDWGAVLGRGVDGEITFVISALLLFLICESAGKGMLEELTDRKFAAMVCV